MEKSLFIEFMGDSPTIRVIDYLLTERNLDFSLTDLAKNSGIGRTTLYNILNSLLKHKIIIPTRIIGKARLYKLNKDNRAIKKIIEVDDTLILESLRKHSEKQKIKITA